LTRLKRRLSAKLQIKLVASAKSRRACLNNKQEEAGLARATTDFLTCLRASISSMYLSTVLQYAKSAGMQYGQTRSRAIYRSSTRLVVKRRR
jgi:hypothetical protein